MTSNDSHITNEVTGVLPPGILTAAHTIKVRRSILLTRPVNRVE